MALREAQYYKLCSRSLFRRSTTSDEISRLGRLKGQVVRIAKRVLRMQEELGRLKEKMVELTRGFSTMKEGLVHVSNF